LTEHESKYGRERIIEVEKERVIGLPNRILENELAR
jgi:hypothetical protein